MKYVAIVRLRVARREDPTGVPPLAEIRALAQRFPGALRDLERLPLAVAIARKNELDRVLDEGAMEPLWSRAQRGYHGGLRVALAAKRAAAGLSTDRNSDAPCLRPADGKLTTSMIAEVARSLGVDTSTCRALIFPWESITQVP